MNKLFMWLFVFNMSLACIGRAFDIWRTNINTERRIYRIAKQEWLKRHDTLSGDIRRVTQDKWKKFEVSEHEYGVHCKLDPVHYDDDIYINKN